MPLGVAPGVANTPVRLRYPEGITQPNNAHKMRVIMHEALSGVLLVKTYFRYQCVKQSRLISVGPARPIGER